jgi:hypothetical protein
VALLAKHEIVFGVDLRDDPAVGELIGLRMARQFKIHELVEIGAAGHEGSFYYVAPQNQGSRRVSTRHAKVPDAT